MVMIHDIAGATHPPDGRVTGFAMITLVIASVFTALLTHGIALTLVLLATLPAERTRPEEKATTVEWRG